MQEKETVNKTEANRIIKSNEKQTKTMKWMFNTKITTFPIIIGFTLLIGCAQTKKNAPIKTKTTDKELNDQIYAPSILEKKTERILKMKLGETAVSDDRLVDIYNYNNQKTGKQKPIFRFSSNSYDLENEVKILKTNNELSYHIFDFNKNLITAKLQSQNGNWKIFKFKIKKSKIKKSLSGLKGVEFDIDNPKCFQVWIDTMGAIGYEFRNGQKLVFYGMNEKENKDYQYNMIPWIENHS